MSTLELCWSALRRRPVSVICTALLAVVSASLVGLPVPLALVAWAATSLLGIMIERAFEPAILRWLGCRPPSFLERERLGPAVGVDPLEVVVLDAAEPWLGRGLRSVIVSRALLDLLEDRAVQGLLTQAVKQVRSASLVGELVVWLGNLPLFLAWVVARWLAQLGRLLAIVVGGSLVVPMLLWPAGFVRWAGRVFGAVIVGLFGAALLSNGLAGPGLGLLLAWALQPGLQALLAWESRHAEHVADEATIEAGLGWQLLEALETLAFAESVPPPHGLLGLFCRRASPFTARADRIWRTLSSS